MRIQKSIEIKDLRIISHKKLDNCFQCDTINGNFIDLAKRAASDKVLCNKEFAFPEDQNLDCYQREFAFTGYDISDMKSADTHRHNTTVGLFIKSNNTEVMENSY